MNSEPKDHGHPSEERKKAAKTTKRDIPSDSQQKTSELQGEPEPYRKEENVDNQKARGNPKEPGHNNSLDKAPFSGGQLSKEKKVHKDNINEKSDRTNPTERG
ncbi:hypothetical protein [Chromohalobacter canadensis]|uniref:hypothetical protein n=1 Tax=Chromohalobacter canadensis TaxID=141389 RepID=UPI00240EE24C|nr:hypothetical protein [Chromohalobacter canadensis]